MDISLYAIGSNAGFTTINTGIPRGQGPLEMKKRAAIQQSINLPPSNKHAKDAVNRSAKIIVKFLNDAGYNGET